MGPQNDVSRRSEEDCSSATSAVGEGQGCQEVVQSHWSGCSGTDKVTSPVHCARLPPIFALVFRVASLRYRLSCESYSKTMALLLFGGPHSSQGNWLGLRCSWLLFHL